MKFRLTASGSQVNSITSGNARAILRLRRSSVGVMSVHFGGIKSHRNVMNKMINDGVDGDALGKAEG